MRKADQLDQIRAALSRPGEASSDYDLNLDAVLPPGRKLRAAGVLVPIWDNAGRAEVLLTKRSSALKHHPGQVAFPGGKQDETDKTIEATALREAYEEIGLSPDNVTILGTLPRHETVTGFLVTPVVGQVMQPFDLVPERSEVDEIFSVPLGHLLGCANYSVEARRWRGHLRKYYTVPYGPYYIWGATARMLHSLAEATMRS